MSVRSALAAGGAPASVAEREAPAATKAMLEAGITTQARASMFLAQVLHESAGLRYFEEIASGSAYEGRRDLGNVHPGDGRRYKGRGPIQLTGRNNYRAAGRDLGLSLEAHPDLAARHDVGWRIAGWYWRTRGLNAYADRGDFRGVTYRINGGYNGWDDRSSRYQRVRKHDCRPEKPDPLTKTERRRANRLIRLRKTWRATSASKRTRKQRLTLAWALRQVVRSRKAVWRAGDRHGWDKHRRRDRFDMLRDLTK